MIPKIIHYCWFGSGDIPDEDKKRIERWHQICPDYKIQRWDESNYDVKKNQYMYEAYKSKKWGFVPDFARIDIIYNHGGIYLDTDVELLKRPDFLLENRGVFGFESRACINLGHGFGAEAGNELLKKMLDFYSNRHFIVNGVPDLTASPNFTTKIMEEYGFSMENKKQYIKGNLLLPTEYFCPRNYISGNLQITKNTVSVHCFSGSWMKPHQRYDIQLRFKLVDKYGKLGGFLAWWYHYIFVHKRDKIVHEWNKHVHGKFISKNRH